jgi:hypothetical protein
MKKRILIFLFVVFIIVNVFLSTTPTPIYGNKFDLALVQVEARADEPETDPLKPDYPPNRVQLYGQILQPLDSSLIR